MTFVLKYILVVFAVYRLSTDFGRGIGPLAIYEKTREFFISKYGVGHWISEGVQCPICISFWLSLLFCILFLSEFSFLITLLIWLSVAGSVALIWRISPQ